MRNFLMAVGLALFGVVSAYGQGAHDIRINEVLVRNVDNYIDAYGKHESWIELYNTGHSSFNVAGCMLTVKVGNDDLTYRIPKNDSRTLIPPQEYLVFFCEGTDTKGTFHTNFTLGEEGYIGFLDAGGNLINEVRYDFWDQEDDISIGWITDEQGKAEFRKLPRTTPMSTNEMAVDVPKSEQFRRQDPSGVIMAITAMSVVFSALLVLYLLFKWVGRTMVKIANRKEVRTKAKKRQIELEEKPKVPWKDTSYSGEVVAAIAMAMKLYQADYHDRESEILTINKVTRAYSPWSSKIYGLRQIPNKK